MDTEVLATKTRASLNSLPAELMFEILKHSSFNDRCSLSLTSRRTRQHLDLNSLKKEIKGRKILNPRRQDRWYSDSFGIISQSFDYAELESIFGSGDKEKIECLTLALRGIISESSATGTSVGRKRSKGAVNAYDTIKNCPIQEKIPDFHQQWFYEDGDSSQEEEDEDPRQEFHLMTAMPSRTIMTHFEEVWRQMPANLRGAEFFPTLYETLLKYSSVETKHVIITNPIILSEDYQPDFKPRKDITITFLPLSPVLTVNQDLSDEERETLTLVIKSCIRSFPQNKVRAVYAYDSDGTLDEMKTRMISNGLTEEEVSRIELMTAEKLATEYPEWISIHRTDASADDGVDRGEVSVKEVRYHFGY